MAWALASVVLTDAHGLGVVSSLLAFHGHAPTELALCSVAPANAHEVGGWSLAAEAASPLVRVADPTLRRVGGSPRRVPVERAIGKLSGREPGGARTFGIQYEYAWLASTPQRNTLLGQRRELRLEEVTWHEVRVTGAC